MSSPTFRFQQFTIRHDRSAMKVGTDGVLLGSWCQPSSGDLHQDERILDVGVGSGLIALMLAQRFPAAEVDGIDIDKSSLEQAEENVAASPFSARIHLWEQDFKDINQNSRRYNLIASNPPFYKEDTLGGTKARDMARHTLTLPFETLTENASKLLTEDGNFSVIIPHTEASDFIGLCALNKLYLRRRTDVCSSERKPPKRVLLEFSKHISPIETNTLTLHDRQNHRTPEYNQLTEAFYLMDYQAIIDKYYPEDNELRHILMEHSRRVADKALAIIDKHPELKANRQFVEEAAMLHDIGIFRCNAPGIQCFGTEPYICHGTIGAELLKAEGFPLHARVCERHTGAGLSLQEIEQQHLPIPHMNLLPETVEEQIVCYADKFFSKTRLTTEKTLEQAIHSLSRFGDEGVERFTSWAKRFG